MVDDTRFRAWTAPSIGQEDGTESGRRRIRLELQATVTSPAGAQGVSGGGRVLLPGPGDVAAITPSAIRRVVPRAGHPDAEGEYYAYIDFVAADLPWRYSPAHPGADDAMLPWIALIAGAEGTEVGLDARGRGWVSAAVTQQLPRGRAGRWAHVHERLGPAGWRTEASRLLCPRTLPDDADCLAMVVPMFRDDGTTHSWTAGQAAFDLPVLHMWRFHTNAAGTFTSLARALVPTKNPPGLGTTSISVEFDGESDTATVFGLLGPLETPDPGGWDDDARVTQEVVDLLASSTTPAGAPVLGPPRYASRWVADVETTSWGAQLNHDPRYRAIAALGTQAGIDWQQRIVDAASRRIGSAHLAAAMLGDLTAAVVLTERLAARRPGGPAARRAATRPTDSPSTDLLCARSAPTTAPRCSAG